MGNQTAEDKRLSNDQVCDRLMMLVSSKAVRNHRQFSGEKVYD